MTNEAGLEFADRSVRTGGGWIVPSDILKKVLDDLILAYKIANKDDECLQPTMLEQLIDSSIKALQPYTTEDV